MRNCILIVVAFCMLTGAAGAADLKQVVFDTWPEGAQIYLVGVCDQYLGRSGEGVDIPLDRPLLNVKFVMDDYYPQTERVDVFYFADRSRYPEPGRPALRLQPTSPLSDVKVWARQHAALAVGMPLLVLSLVAFGVTAFRRRWHEQLRQAMRLERLAPVLASSDPMLGAKMGAYRTVELIGAGSTGRVYRAVPDASMNDEESVAVKVIRGEHARSAEYVERFSREARIISRLMHPNIVKAIDFEAAASPMYLVMEYLNGTTLEEWLKAHARLDLPRFLAILRPVMSAIQAAHEHGVVHRDLKPGNIMLTDKGRPVVMDFGIAKTCGSATLTPDGYALGTPAYVSPEVVRGDQVDARSDQYSLGVIAYEMLAGTRPFIDEDVLALFYKHISDVPPDLRQARTDLPAEVCAVIHRMLSKQPGQRYTNMAQALTALEQAAERTAVRPELPTIGPYQVQRTLGEGGMGRVFAVTYGGRGRTYALKVLHQEASDAESRERFRREIQIAIRLQHPNVCRAVDWGMVEGQGFLVTELLEGRSLEDVMAGGPMGLDTARGLIVQALNGLAYVHQAGVTHRDLKPSNLFVTEQGWLKILDFGIAKNRKMSTMTSTAILGSPRYLAPERLRRPEDADPRSDLFSIGVIFYEMLAGCSPYADDDLLLQQVMMGSVTPISQHRPDLPMAIVNWIDRLLARNPADRFSSAAAAVAALPRSGHVHLLAA